MIQNKRDTSEAVIQSCSVKKLFLEISQNSQENTCARVSFLAKLHASGSQAKETLAQVFSCEFCGNHPPFLHEPPPPLFRFIPPF